MVNYSLINRANPRDKDASKKTYAIAQYTGVMNLEKFPVTLLHTGVCTAKRISLLS